MILSPADREAVVALLADAERIARALYRRHREAFAARAVTPADAVAEAWWGLCQAVGRAADDWRSYALSVAARAVQRLLRRHKAAPLTVEPAAAPEAEPTPAWDDLTATLDDDGRDLLRLAYHDGLSAREIARRTGRSKDAIARSLRAARGRVAEMVA